jgi:hypothetical protein
MLTQTHNTAPLAQTGTELTHGAYSNIWMYPQAASGIGTLTLRKNGWFSFNTVGEDPATLVTTAVVVPPLTSTTASERRAKSDLPAAAQRQLVVRLNVLSSVRGWVRCELRDATTDTPIPGYDLNSSVAIIAQNSLSAQLTWQSTEDRGPQVSPGQRVTIHFQATFSKLFSFELVWQ